LKEFGYDYTFGNPFKQLTIFESMGKKYGRTRYIPIFYYGIVQNEFALVKHTIETGNEIISKYDVRDAAGLNDPTILNYLLQNGGDVSFFDDEYELRFVSKECKKYLVKNYSTFIKALHR
jgi:hypothetical protein